MQQSFQVEYQHLAVFARVSSLTGLGLGGLPFPAAEAAHACMVLRPITPAVASIWKFEQISSWH